MKNEFDKFRPPKGTRDYFESDLIQRELMESLFFGTARSFGFQRIETPTFEHFEVFNSTSRLNREKCYNFNDKSERELVLRSDLNAPISRAVVNNFSELPIPAKFFFNSNVYRYRHYLSREFTMSGLESYGIKGYEAEIEILLVMNEILKNLGLKDYRIEFSNLNIYSEYLNYITKKYNLDIDQEKILYRLSFSHSYQENVEILSSLPKMEADIICQMLSCKGGIAESISLLSSFFEESPILKDEFDKIVDFDQKLVAHGFINRKFDITNLHGIGFYTGLTYRFYSDTINKKIADGGRYDTFTKSLGGKEIPATGIGFTLNRLMDLAKLQGSFQIKKPRSFLVVADDKIPFHDLENLLNVFRSNGWVVELEMIMRKFPQRLKYAKLKNYFGIVYLKYSDVFRFEFFDTYGKSLLFKEESSLNSFEDIFNVFLI